MSIQPADDGAETDYEGYECAKCEADVSGRDAFCWRCGRRLDPLDGCPSCGAQVFEADQFCRQCGRALGQDVVSENPSELIMRGKDGVLPYLKGSEAARLEQLIAEVERSPSAANVAELASLLDRFDYL